jgi:hypothetical protein
MAGYLKQFLLTAFSLDIRSIVDETDRLGGIAIPAHVDRDSYSIISNLGMVPEGLDISCVEVSYGCSMRNLLECIHIWKDTEL